MLKKDCLLFSYLLFIFPGIRPGFLISQNKKSLRKPSENFIFPAVFLCKNLSMNEYINKLKSLGFSANEAYRIWWDFMKNYGKTLLDEFIEELRRDLICG